MIRTYVGSEVGDAATCSIRSDEVSRLMITICRRKIVPLGTCLFSLSALHVHKYDCLISLIFGVLFSWSTGRRE